MKMYAEHGKEKSIVKQILEYFKRTEEKCGLPLLLLFVHYCYLLHIISDLSS